LAIFILCLSLPSLSRATGELTLLLVAVVAYSMSSLIAGGVAVLYSVNLAHLLKTHPRGWLVT
jgi:hypothetical protein